jgi:hypothetical protein
MWSRGYTSPAVPAHWKEEGQAAPGQHRTLASSVRACASAAPSCFSLASTYQLPLPP